MARGRVRVSCKRGWRAMWLSVVLFGASIGLCSLACVSKLSLDDRPCPCALGYQCCHGICIAENALCPEAADAASSMPDAGASSMPDAGASGDDAAPPQPPPACCVPEAPADWSGPVRVGRGADIGECPSALPEVAFKGGVGVEAEAGSCDCSCVPETPHVTCPNPEVRWYESSGCVGAVLSRDPIVPPIACDLIYPNGSIAWDALPVGTCSAVAEAKLPPPRYSEVTLGCAATNAESCPTGQTCLPDANEPGFDAVCLFRDGNHDCPSGPYSERSVINTGFDDERHCEGCSCEAAGFECSIKFTVFISTGGCAVSGNVGLREFVTGTETCSFDGNVRSFLVTENDRVEVSKPGTCAPSNATLEGTVSPGAPVTVCCLP
jgi:hypothetical protein